MKKRYRNIVIIGIFILSLISIGFSEEELTCVHYQDSSSMNGFKPDFRHKLNSGNNASAIALIPPSQANVYTLNIYVSFPDHPEHHELPSFCTSIESSVQNYFEEMSYGSHHVHLTTAHRPSPNVSKCYIADNPAWFYNCCFCQNCPSSREAGLGILTTEILSKAYADDPNIFNGIQMLFLNLTDKIFEHHTAVSALGNHTFPHYNGPGTTQYFVDEEGLEWSIAHEYGHQLGLAHPPGNNEKKYYGMYNLMYNRHQTNASGEGGANPFCGYDLYFHLNWLPASRFVDVTSDLFDESIGDIRTSGKLYRLTINSTYNEHLFIENHQGTGSDGLYNGTGLLIWHRRGSTILDIECASGQWSGSNPDPLTGTDALDDNIDVVYNGSADDFFDGMGNDNFSQLTNPCTNGYSVSSRHAAENILSHKAILNIIKVGSGSSEIKADFITNFWAGNIISNTSWNSSTNPYYIGGNIIVSDATTLTVTTGAVVNLNGNAVKITGTGSFIRQTGSTFNPDIRLLNGTTLKGQYPTIQSAMADATSSDQIIVDSNITVTGTLLLACNVLVESGASVTFNQSNTILNGKYIRALNAVNGTFVLNYATFSPDIRLRRGNVIKGFFPSTAVAMQFACSDDLVEINSGDPWNSNFTVVCDILVNPSGEVTIPAAKTILFEPDTRVTVRGDLISNGQYGANKVYLRAVPGNTWSRGIWDGIWFESGGEGVLNQTCIINADYGSFLGAGSFFEANNCYFQNNYWGIYGNNASDCTLDWCMFNSNSTAGVTAYPLNFDMGWCTVQGNGDGIQLQSSYPEIDRTKITQNTSRGVVASGGTIDMGTSSSDYGYNSIYNNSSYEMDVFPYAYILACGNYWGGGQPTDIHYNNGGNVIWWPYLPYPPLNKNQIAPNEQQIPTLAKPKPNENVILADPLSLIIPAIELRKNKDYAAAASSLEAIINEYPQSEAALAALWELARTYHKAKTDSPGVKLASNLSTTLSRMLPNFKSSKSEVHSQLYPTALKLLTYNYLQTNTPASAIETCQQLIKEFPGTSFEEEGWWSLFNTYYFLLADTSQAKSCYEQLKQNFPKSEFLVHAYHALDLDDVQPFVKEELDAEIPPPIPVKYYLSSVYPNPFNSSTIIKYDLPESDQVSLKIFNIEGKLVTELVNKTQSAGTYQVVWDGKNSQQEAVTSGIYFCQFKTRQYWQTVRVILLR